MIFKIDQRVRLKSGEILGVTNHEGVILATNYADEPKGMDDGDRLYSIKFSNKAGQFGQSNNLTLARIMIGAIPKEQYEQGDITGSNRGISVFIEFEGEPKRITITDVADEIPQDKSPREGRPMV